MIKLGSDKNEQIGELVYVGIYLAYFCFSIEPWMDGIYEGSETNQLLRMSPFCNLSTGEKPVNEDGQLDV